MEIHQKYKEIHKKYTRNAMEIHLLNTLENTLGNKPGNTLGNMPETAQGNAVKIHWEYTGNTSKFPQEHSPEILRNTIEI